MTSRPSVGNNRYVLELASNFDGNIIATSNCITNSYTGEVNVYSYNILSNSWISIGNLTGPSTNSYFVKSIDINWDGTRIVVGSNALARVYVYDYNGTSWNYYSNVLQSDSGSDFGFSVSISKDESKTIAVGAPQANNVYIYETVSDVTWEISNVLSGSHIENVVGYDATSNLILISDYNRYGESVKLSGFGDYVIVGQPGTILSNIYSSDTTNFEIVAEGEKELDGGVRIIPPLNQIYEYFNYFPYVLTRQEGSVQVFKTDGSWKSSNVQVGSTLYGEMNCLITDEARLGEGAWSSSGFGLEVDISLDGQTIVIAAPLYSINGGVIHVGRVYTYNYNSVNSEWYLKNSFNGSGRQGLSGFSFKLDYIGGRMAIMSTNNKANSSYRVLDWNGNDWYDVKPISYIGQILDSIFNKITITNGTHIFIKRGDSVNTYDVTLTQNFEGNSLFSGYVSTPRIYIGTNDGDTTADNSSLPVSKIVAFGGTFGEDTYNSTTIENRVYETYGGIAGSYEHLTGRSELLIAKTNSDGYIPPESAGGVDYIRLKASEIHIDSHDYIRLSDDKYDMTPVFVMNYRGHIGIKIPEVEPYDKEFRSRTRTKADLDINGSMYSRNKITVNYTDRSNIINKDSLPAIFWDTRNINILQGNQVYSNTFTNGFNSVSSTASGGVSYSQENFSFLFTNSSGQIKPDGGDLTFIHVFYPEINLWFKLTLEHNVTNYPGNSKIMTLGNITESKYASLVLTPTGIALEFKNVSSTCVLSNTITFNTNEWYHINAKISPNAIEPTTGNNIIYINNNSVNLNLTGDTMTSDMNLVSGYGQWTLGAGIHDAYIGMITAGFYNSGRLPQYNHWYNYGPPDEVLAVGGSATIAGKLGIGVTNPSEALEVNGIIKNNNPRFYAKNESVNSTTSTGVLNVFDSTFVNTGNHYNTTTSRFTAPVPGVYMFKFAGLHRYVSSGGSCELTFAKNGSVVSTRGLSLTYVTVSGDNDYNTAEVMLALIKGDYIEPYIHDITSGTDLYYGGGLSQFSGYLMG